MSAKTWCDEDEHRHFEHFADFNNWLDNEDGETVRTAYALNRLSNPSKAFFAGDREAYDEAFQQYREERRHEVLGEQFIEDSFGDDHWFEINVRRFDQLVERLYSGDVLPFVGAGVSVSGGFSSWKDHLKHQGQTAGLNAEDVAKALGEGRYEEIIDQIEASLGHDVFVQDIRDEFDRTGSIPSTVYLLAELFKDTVITTNYDRLLEQAYDVGEPDPVQIITSANATDLPEPDKVTVIKLHGDIRQPQQCILSKNQYDAAYGNEHIDLELPIPKVLDYHFRNNSLLFLGCSLQNDRTVQVFDAIKQRHIGEDLPQHFVIEQCPENVGEIVERNAFLVGIGLTGIWFEKGRFELIEGILTAAQNELNYKAVRESAAG
ncbi:MAG: SIR2 family NAD-dependent protein deacylase [Kiloniellales bacterium]